MNTLFQSIYWTMIFWTSALNLFQILSGNRCIEFIYLKILPTTIPKFSEYIKNKSFAINLNKLYHLCSDFICFCLWCVEHNNACKNECDVVGWYCTRWCLEWRVVCRVELAAQRTLSSTPKVVALAGSMMRWSQAFVSLVEFSRPCRGKPRSAVHC